MVITMESADYSAHTRGAKLRALRMSKQLRQEDIAAATGISRSQISRMEAGYVKKVEVWKLKALADYFGITLDELLDPETQLTVTTLRSSVKNEERVIALLTLNEALDIHGPEVAKAMLRTYIALARGAGETQTS